MMDCGRRKFIQGLAAAGALEFGSLSAFARSLAGVGQAKSEYKPGRIDTEYSLFPPGEREALAFPPLAANITPTAVELAGSRRKLAIGQIDQGWSLMAVAHLNGAETAVFEKRVTHRGAIAYVTKERGVIASIPKMIGNLASIRPRQINAQGAGRLERSPHYVPGPDLPGNYILGSDEDPCYENVAALGKEYIGWTFAGSEQGGASQSIFLEASGKSRQLHAAEETAWAPDAAGYVFDPSLLLPRGNPALYEYIPGYSKRTLLGGYLPVANVGVWNPQ